MSIYEIGRICVKIAGRDAGRKCVVVENVDDKFVMIDGNVRRKKVNIKHLEPLAETVEIKDKASHEDVKAAFDKLGLAVWDKKSKKPTERPKKVRKVKKKVVEEKSKKEQKAEKKEAKAEKKEVTEQSSEAASSEPKAPKSKDSESSDKPAEVKKEVSVEEKQEVEELSAAKPEETKE
ncbi:50S ribosomal protein L14e [Candidatus Woesearchaeota archaeon]|nr:50S ribosomal protein L14e [Candidatus Woesearchaeota archaeon]MBT5342344.1 50S ribosomal protein L14e [Candidatus Woesearchaeota archaeon]